MKPTLSTDRWGFELQFTLAPDYHFAGFTFCKGPAQPAAQAALEEYGAPSKGLMVVRKGNKWAMSDGVDAGTGQPYTAERMDIIKSQFDEVHVLD